VFPDNLHHFAEHSAAQEARKLVNTIPSIIEQKRTGASLVRGQSKQDYETPMEFIRAVEKRFGPLTVDLAASAENAKAPRHISEKENSLICPWAATAVDNCWLNPPFGNIAPWAKKCAEESEHGARILMLVPASIGSNWFAEHVHDTP
jgi:phage N-6-adenine-methyltransferase